MRNANEIHNRHDFSKWRSHSEQSEQTGEATMLFGTKKVVFTLHDNQNSVQTGRRATAQKGMSLKIAYCSLVSSSRLHAAMAWHEPKGEITVKKTGSLSNTIKRYVFN